MKPRGACGVLSAWSIIITISLLFSAGTLIAQVDTGSISGTVTDSTGAVIKGAAVKLKNEATNAEISTTSGADGDYIFSPVRIGSYTLTTSNAGFETAVAKGVVVNVNARVLINITLKPGATTEMVEVTTAAPLLQTQDASVGQVVDSRAVNNLPLNGRNFTFLAQIVQGVNTPQADTRGNAGTGAFSANGFRPAQNNYMLDGIDNNSDTVDFLNGTNYVVLPPLEAVQEFKVQTTNFSAEFGRSGAAVLNASIKSGTNSFHGAAWEFVRNDKFDARDWFERNGAPKGAFRQNQFGFTAGGPVVIPHVFDGRNKVFFFGDFEALRVRQGRVAVGAVPTLLERNSGYTDLTDLITLQSGSTSDTLGRTMPLGTVLDPATTRPTSAGVADPVTGLTAVSTGFVRDPFQGAASECAANTTNFTLAACDLNQLPAGRLDANAIALLNLFPSPTNDSLFTNYVNSPKFIQNRRSFDTRLDVNFSQKDQTFFRFTLADDPQFIPAIFGGIADGGGFQQGNQTALAQQGVLVWTHTFSPTMVNVARGGLNYLHTTRVSPEANNLTDLPGQYGIQGIPQLKENGGLPAFGINGLQTLGSNAFLPSDEVSSTIQFVDDFTKIYGKHTFKAGFEVQHVKFSTLQPPWSRGQFNFDGPYTDVPNVGGGNTGRAQFLLTPTAATVPGGVDYVGGPNTVFISNIALTDNGKNYYGSYIQDDWKVTPKLTLNLGLRWDFFGLVYEHHHAQANFVPGGPPTGSPMYLLPAGNSASNLSTSFTTLLAQDGIQLKIGNDYGKGLGRSQKTNFAPRFGFAYQVTPKLVARGGFGVFFNGFENRGYSPNIGENYPFQFSFAFFRPDDNHSIVYNDTNGEPCAANGAGPIGNATLETGFACTPLDPLTVNASGLQLRGIQFDYRTPYSMGGNLTLQYQITPTLSFQAGYVTTMARHLESFPGANNVNEIIPADGNADLHKQFLDFSRGGSYAATIGNSYYHSLQTKLEKQFGNGLSFLATYTWAKTRTDAGDLLNGGSVSGYRAPGIYGIHIDYGLASFDVRNVFHFSGGYELPFGKGKRYMNGASGATNALLGGWSVQWSSTIQGGQPVGIGCPSTTAAGTNCTAFKVAGKTARTSIHINPATGNPTMLNADAFAQPCEFGAPGTPAGCVELSGLGLLGGAQPYQVEGPSYRRLDSSVFKDFKLSERFRLQFRTEIFNVFNHPNFNAPGFGGNGVVSIPGSTNFTNASFGDIGSTREGSIGQSPREIQFALKLYY